MLEGKDLGYAIGRKALLSGVSVAVRPGELLAIVGPNGAGKSTLLRLLAGEAKPQTGTLTIDGRAMHQWPARELARRRAVLPQSSTLSFPFTAGEVVLLGRGPHNIGIESPGDRAIARHALEAAGVAHLAQRAYPSLSGGEKQRVHLARVLAQLMARPGEYVPGYLLLDEPVTSLDPRHQHAALVLTRAFVDQGGAALAILHDVNLAARYADRAVVLAAGRVAAAGSIADALTPAVLAPVFEMPFRQIADPEGGPPILLAA